MIRLDAKKLYSYPYLSAVLIDVLTLDDISFQLIIFGMWFVVYKSKTKVVVSSRVLPAYSGYVLDAEPMIKFINLNACLLSCVIYLR
jgi:hypothetical protein